MATFTLRMEASIYLRMVRVNGLLTPLIPFVHKSTRNLPKVQKQIEMLQQIHNIWPCMLRKKPRFITISQEINQ